MLAIFVFLCTLLKYLKNKYFTIIFQNFLIMYPPLSGRMESSLTYFSRNFESKTVRFIYRVDFRFRLWTLPCLMLSANI